LRITWFFTSIKKEFEVDKNNTVDQEKTYQSLIIRERWLSKKNVSKREICIQMKTA